MKNKATAPSLNWIRTGPADAPTVLLLHAVGYDLTYWDRQIDALQPGFNVVAVDLPGHGRSSGQPQDWTFPNAAAVIGRCIETVADRRPVHLVGLSFGGMVAQATALAHPHLIRSLTLIGTASTFPEPARAAMRARAETLRAGGMPAVLGSSLDRWFTPAFRTRRPDIIDRVTKTLLAGDPTIQAAIWEIIARFDVHDQLSRLRCPTLILVGKHDPSTPPSAASAIAQAISGAKLVVIPDASHILSVEAPEAVITELLPFLAAHEPLTQPSLTPHDPRQPHPPAHPLLPLSPAVRLARHPLQRPGAAIPRLPRRLPPARPQLHLLDHDRLGLPRVHARLPCFQRPQSRHAPPDALV